GPSFFIVSLLQLGMIDLRRRVPRSRAAVTFPPGAPASSPAGPQASRLRPRGGGGTPPGQPPGRRRASFHPSWIAQCFRRAVDAQQVRAGRAGVAVRAEGKRRGEAGAEAV